MMLAPTPDFDGRLALAKQEWRLTERQTAVLRRLALGDANKEIAGQLRITVRTVELHVGDLMRRANVESRLRLVAKLWMGA